MGRLSTGASSGPALCRQGGNICDGRISPNPSPARTHTGMSAHQQDTPEEQHSPPAVRRESHQIWGESSTRRRSYWVPPRARGGPKALRASLDPPIGVSPERLRSVIPGEGKPNGGACRRSVQAVGTVIPYVRQPHWIGSVIRISAPAASHPPVQIPDVTLTRTEAPVDAFATSRSALPGLEMTEPPEALAQYPFG